jgi:opacity protein-like surface antigen
MPRRLSILLVVPLVAFAAACLGEDSLQPVSLRGVEGDGNRFYLAGIMGASFATLTATDAPAATDPLFTSGGAAGIAFDMLDRDWRLEVEGRARDPLAETLPLGDGVSTSSLTGSGCWSATVNLWRDYELTDRLDFYVGGGIGGGGYRLGVNQEFPVQNVSVAGLGTVGGFAWQVGGGLAHALTERVTLDLGYRFFSLASGPIVADVAQGGVPWSTVDVDSGFSASDLFFAIRVHEPFRGWR